MAEDEEEVPEYLKELQEGGPTVAQDNFGPEDVVWTGEDGKLDPYEILDEHGFEPETNLENLLAAVTKGHNPGISDEDLRKRIARATKAISNSERAVGRPKTDDYAIIKEVAWAFHEASYMPNRAGKLSEWPSLRPIVGRVIEEQFPSVSKERNMELDNLCRVIERKFKKHMNVNLVRATCDDDYDRFRENSKLRKVVDSMRELGIPADATGISRRVLTKNSRRSRGN